MKKSLITLATMLFVLICAGAYHLSQSSGTGHTSLDDSGKAYADQTLPRLLADLSTDNFFKYAGTVLIKSAPREDFDAMFDWFSRLGPLKNYGGAFGEVSTTIFADRKEEYTGEYAARVEFQSGPAIVRVMIILENKQWKINGISIESKALMQG